MRIAEAFDLYKEHILFVGQHPTNALRCENIKKQLIAKYGNKSVARLSLDDIQQWLYDMQATHTDGTIRRTAIVMRSFLKFCKQSHIRCLDYELIPVPKAINKPRAFLTAEEVTKMIESAYNIRAKFVISLLYSSGIRLGELVQLNRDSIKDRQFTVVGKGRKVRVCFIDRRTEQLMRRYLRTRKDDNPALIFSLGTKDRASDETIQTIIKFAAKRAHITKKVSPHVFRHSFATNFLKNNGNLRYLSAMLGHSSMDTTAIYTHVVDMDLKKQYRRYHTI